MNISDAVLDAVYNSFAADRPKGAAGAVAALAMPDSPVISAKRSWLAPALGLLRQAWARLPADAQVVLGEKFPTWIFVFSLPPRAGTPPGQKLVWARHWFRRGWIQIVWPLVRRLAEPEAACVYGHEMAHRYLRLTDPAQAGNEAAADRLAAAWGFDLAAGRRAMLRVMQQLPPEWLAAATRPPKPAQKPAPKKPAPKPTATGQKPAGTPKPPGQQPQRPTPNRKPHLPPPVQVRPTQRPPRDGGSGKRPLGEAEA
jgi:hypothetical protein